MMRIQKLFLIPVLAASLVAGACQVRQTEEGELPDVDVEGGNLPEYDVDAPEVRVGSDTQMIVTPDVDVIPADQDTSGVVQ